MKLGISYKASRGRKIWRKNERGAEIATVKKTKNVSKGTAWSACKKQGRTREATAQKEDFKTDSRAIKKMHLDLDGRWLFHSQ